MFEQAVSRLEAVALRLEAAEGRLSGRPAGSLPPPPPVAAAAAPPAAHAATVGAAPQTSRAVTGCSITAPTAAAGGGLAAYNSEVMPKLDAFMVAAAPLGDDVGKPSAVVKAAFDGQRHIVEAIASCSRPDQGGLQQLVGPVGEQMGQANALTEGRRSTAFHHCKAVAEALGGLSWVVYSGPSCGMNPPGQHVADAWSSAEFWANKLLVEHRNSDGGKGHVEWVKSLKALLGALEGYVKAHHASGPSWNPAGGPLASFEGNSGSSNSNNALAAPAAQPAAATKPTARGGPPPPPPPPPAGGPGSLLDRGTPAGSPSAAPAADSRATLLAALNKGDSVTGGLRKVTDDMKTKNRADRTGAVPAAAVSSPAKAAPAAARGAAAVAAKPPRLELEGGRKWVIEHQVNNKEIIVEVTDPKQTAYIYACTGSTIQVRGKLNAVTLDQCTKTALVFENVVASCEIVNSKSVQVQCTGIVPTVAIDKVDGCQLYLSKESLGASVLTAKSSEVNVVTPGATEEDDFLEAAIPEQFISTYANGKWTTEAVTHSGG